MGHPCYCSICGVYYGKHGSLHRCTPEVLRNLDKGRKTFGDEGRVEGHSFRERLKEADRLMFPDGGSER